MCQLKSFSSLILTILLVVNIRDVTSEVFTAVADMEELLETEAVMIANLEGYINIQEEKLESLRRWVAISE